MQDLHLVTNGSSAGSLQAAIDTHQMRGTVFSVDDVYSVGPLADGPFRARFWRACYDGAYYDELLNEVDSHPLMAWDRLLLALERNKPLRILIWVGGDASDYIFLRMACRYLANIQIPLFCVRIPRSSSDEAYPVAYYSPEALVHFAPAAKLVSMDERQRWSEEFRIIANRPEMLRECDAEGQLRYVDLDAYDELVFEQCTEDWQMAALVVGITMGKMAPDKMQGDAFLCSRLQHLINDGRVEADGVRTNMRSYRVRRALSVAG